MDEDRMRKVFVLQHVLLLTIGCFVSQLHASDNVKFFDSFTESFEGTWIVSEKEDYEGVWKRVKSEGHDDYGLLVTEQAKKHAIVKELDEPVVIKDGTVVLQYEVRLQNGLECGGAYIKYLRPQDAGWIPKDFDHNSPYTIMFGPDKCGATNKVHFILNHKNPRSGKYIEHHLKYPPSVPSDKLTHVYTAIVKPGNELRILIDGEEKKKANFFSADDFEPPIIPPKTIIDPDDKKPEDWDERAKIPDLEAKKPDDWDEEAPMEIVDKDAVKPEGWLEDEPEEVDDPEATKPEDWNDDEDGEWEAPKIDNPKCEGAPGCGEWTKPMKKNPAYKGKWMPPLVKNPNYKGTWKPQLIGNSDYFELDTPNFDPIAAIGIEIWTMQNGILFDNILIASDDEVATHNRETMWKPKFEVEKTRKDQESTASNGLKGVQKMVFGYMYKAANLPFLGEHNRKILDLLEKAEKQPNITIGIILSVAVLTLTVVVNLIFGGNNRPDKITVQNKKTDASDSSNNQEIKKEHKEDAAAAPHRRNKRRDN